MVKIIGAVLIVAVSTFSALRGIVRDRGNLDC